MLKIGSWSRVKDLDWNKISFPIQSLKMVHTQINTMDCVVLSKRWQCSDVYRWTHIHTHNHMLCIQKMRTKSNNIWYKKAFLNCLPYAKPCLPAHLPLIEQFQIQTQNTLNVENARITLYVFTQTRTISNCTHAPTSRAPFTRMQHIPTTKGL